MRRALISTLIFLLLLVGCTLPQDSSPTPTRDTPPSPTPTSTSSPTAQATPTKRPSSTATPRPPTNEPPPTSPAPSPVSSTSLSPLTPGEEVTIKRIEMISALTGWAIGSQNEGPEHILYTDDGGATWMDRTPPTTISQDGTWQIKVHGHFRDENTAWAIYSAHTPPPVSQQVVWRTSDAGQTWSASQSLPLTGQEPMFAPKYFSFIDSQQGWLLVHVDSGMSHEYSHLFATDDGGESWERVMDPFGNALQSLHNTDMSFANPKVGWVTKDNLGVMPGAFFEKTFDGGHTWESIFLPSPDDLNLDQVGVCRTYSPTFTSQQTRLLLLQCESFNNGSTHQYVYATSDGGDTWQHTKLPGPVFELEFVSVETGYALGKDIYKTVNGGQDWNKVKTVFWEGDFSFVDKVQGWAVARKKNDVALVRTTDGARSWDIIQPVIAP